MVVEIVQDPTFVHVFLVILEILASPLIAQVWAIVTVVSMVIVQVPILVLVLLVMLALVVFCMTVLWFQIVAAMEIARVKTKKEL